MRRGCPASHTPSAVAHSNSTPVAAARVHWLQQDRPGAVNISDRIAKLNPRPPCSPSVAPPRAHRIPRQTRDKSRENISSTTYLPGTQHRDARHTLIIGRPRDFARTPRTTRLRLNNFGQHHPTSPHQNQQSRVCPPPFHPEPGETDTRHAFPTGYRHNICMTQQ